MRSKQLLMRLLCTAMLIATAACAEEKKPEMPAGLGAATGGDPNPRIVEFHNYEKVLDLFEELNYTPAAWQAGIREVPRVYLREVSEYWSKVTTREIDVTLKKRLFFRAIAPLALRSNELILADRAQLEKLLAATTEPDTQQQAWLDELAIRYRLEPTEATDRSALLDQLLERVDIVPPALVLAQAAEESGWGTSRFAFTGNALFGQWSWDGDGIRPEQQRKQKGDYRIAAFNSPLESVQAHALNLNTHRAYTDFRARRAALRTTGDAISGYELAETLSSYSERGTEYIESLRSIMNYNKLNPADDAYLSDGQAIILVRVETAAQEDEN